MTTLILTYSNSENALKHNFSVWQGYALNDVCLCEFEPIRGKIYALSSKSNECVP
jgi:hypothetical protein